MPHPLLSRSARLVALSCMLLILTACGGGGGAFRAAEGPYLAPGPLPGAGHVTLRATPALPASPTGRPNAGPAPAGVPGMPVGLTASQGTGVLPGGGMAGIGPVHGLVIPVSLGPSIPLRDDVALLRDYFGSEPGASAPTLVEQMRAISGGLFRPTFEVLPSLVDSRRGVLPQAPSPRQLMAFAEAVLRTAAERGDLSRFDNDGPDGMPGSRDDDGQLDFVLLVVESEASFPSVTLRQDLAIPTPTGTLRSGPIHILCLSRSEAPDIRPAIGLWLDGLGLDPGERFFPSTFARGVSSLARSRLGWLPVEPVTEAGTTAIADGRALLFPLQDLAAGAGFWLIEREGARVYASRVARKADGHFFATEAHTLAAGEGQVLPLTRQFGERGSRVVVRWPEGEDGPAAQLVTVATRPADPVPLRRP